MHNRRERKRKKASIKEGEKGKPKECVLYTIAYQFCRAEREKSRKASYFSVINFRSYLLYVASQYIVY